MTITLTERGLTWMMRLYPPMLFQRIWVQKVHPDFRGIDVKINRTVFTTNLGKAIFGGTIFSASDPFCALLLGQILRRKGYRITVWLKSAQIQYLKPARSDCYFSFVLREETIGEAVVALEESGKYIKTFFIEIKNKSGDTIASVLNEVYIRNLEFDKKR